MKPDSPQNDQSENQGSSPDSAAGNTGFFQKILTGIMFAVAFVAMIFVKPAQYLNKQVYNNSSASTVAWCAGILLSMAAGIGTGYPMWLAHSAVAVWVPLALGAVATTYYYLWPALYLAVFRWAFEFSRFLWRNVPEMGASRSSNPVWFSNLLGGLAMVAGVLACIALAWQTGTSLYSWLHWTSTFGSLVALVGSGIVGIIVGWIAGFVAISILKEVAMPALALASGGALSWHYTDRLTAVVQQYDMPHGLVYALQALIVLAVAGYIFPLIHVLISRCFNFVGKYLRDFAEYCVEAYGAFIESVYGDKDEEYVGFIYQSANIVIAYVLGQLAFVWASSFGLPGAIAVTAVAALTSYLVIGTVLNEFKNFSLGVVAALATAAAVWFVPALQVFAGAWYIVAGQAAVAAVLAFFVVIPVAYRLVKLVVKPLLASWLAEPLNSLHQSIRRELFSANSNTYNDKTGFEALFSHLVNVVTTVSAYFAVNLAVATLSISGLSAVVMPIVAVIFAYLFLGKLLLRYGNHLIGGIVGLAMGVYVGVEVFGHYGQNYWYAIPSFAIAAVLTSAVVYPVAYVLVRALINAARGMNWLLPVVGGLYNFLFGFVSKFWAQFVVVYKRLEASFKPIWQNLSRTWDESWESAKAAINKAWNQTKK